MSDEDASNVTPLGPVERGSALRILEALLFAASEPLDVATLQSHLDDDADAVALLDDLRGLYAGRGVNLVNVAGRWAFRTAPDLGYLLERHQVETRRLSKAALETLSIIAYHQPVTRAQIEEVRGVQTSKGTLDVLLETGWVRPRGRRRAPGRPLTYGTTDGFLEHFGFANLGDLPGAKDLKEAGLLDAQVPEHFAIPDPEAVADLMPDELPLDADDDEHDDPMSPSLPFEEDASDGDALARDELDEGTGGAEKRANGRRRS
ncbi:MAG: SMC-Scp complex subunit ScpB [Pseudomonadota bacterium]